MTLGTLHLISWILALRILIHSFHARLLSENITGGIVSSQLLKLGELSAKPSITKHILMLLLLLFLFLAIVCLLGFFFFLRFLV